MLTAAASFLPFAEEATELHAPLLPRAVQSTPALMLV